MPFDLNPFPVASNRHAIWEMLVRKDVGGFVAQDWKIFAPSFKFEGFCGTASCRGRRFQKQPWHRNFDLDQLAVPAKLVVIKPRRKKSG
ncbi:hypothetical protein [Rhizobium leguminosarum]|uniref:hypothetical protein n=1 Tax=Rhizobium leguminosarum TaxID=384 RepID=UPI001C9590D4|nr:hypothetical protein [Rhizobium leguminosarum]MBY5364575.1 hypothetical protein [Rhizobium leguminosarum]MBY5666649.1 hypothetical protein [Rhizobium leguminosarum]MBY5680521.1 hypothetical protein [Rhizobium leguminosarum]